MSGRNTPTLGGVGTPGSVQNMFSVEVYGAALPALVKEALTFAESEHLSFVWHILLLTCDGSKLKLRDIVLATILCVHLNDRYKYWL